MDKTVVFAPLSMSLYVFVDSEGKVPIRWMSKNPINVRIYSIKTKKDEYVFVL